MIGNDCYLIPVAFFQMSWISGDVQNNQIDQNASHMASAPLFHRAVIRKPPECVGIVTTDSREKFVVGFCVQYWCRTDMEWKSLKLRRKKAATQVRRVKERSKTLRSVATKSTCPLGSTIDEGDEEITVASGTLSQSSSTVLVNESKLKTKISEDEGFEGVFKEDIGGSDEEVQGKNEVSMVHDTVVEEENPKSMDGDVSSGQNGIQSEDQFNIYSLLNKNNMKNNKESSTKESLEYPPGFTPREDVVENVERDNQRKSFDCDFGNVRNISDEANSSPRNNTYKKEGRESVGSGHFRKSEVPRTGGYLLTLMDELIKVGQTMGYYMEGCMKNIEEIIESQGVDAVFRWICCP
ncbi:hypothetical protein Tco_0402003 [Tanacetum coccineum]